MYSRFSSEIPDIFDNMLLSSPFSPKTKIKHLFIFHQNLTQKLKLTWNHNLLELSQSPGHWIPTSCKDNCVIRICKLWIPFENLLNNDLSRNTKLINPQLLKFKTFKKQLTSFPTGNNNMSSPNFWSGNRTFEGHLQLFLRSQQLLVFKCAYLGSSLFM